MDSSAILQEAALIAGGVSAAATALGGVASAAGALFNLLGWQKAAAFAGRASTAFSSIGLDFKKLFAGTPAAPVAETRHSVILPPPN